MINLKKQNIKTQKTKQKLLVVDLDETLVHTSFDYIENPNLIITIDLEDDEEEEEEDEESKNEEKNEEKNNEEKESSSDSSYVVKEEVNESENYDNADQESGVSIKKAERNKKK